MPAQNGRYWMATIAEARFTVPTDVASLPEHCTWIKGQLEEGGRTGFKHWQLIIGINYVIKGYQRNIRRAKICRDFGEQNHYELTRSVAADSYVWKEDTRVPNTQFEVGQKAIRFV